MSQTILTVKQRPVVPLEAEVIAPDVFAPLPHAEVRALPVFLGKRQCRLDEFFDVEGDGSEEILIRGDAGRVRWIGRGMMRGRITVEGDAGMHLGAYMKGGTIEVTGNASDWVGGEMKSGLIRVRGNAGGQVGSAYRGSLKGMKGGVILIGGTAGIEIGMRMRRGLIAVGGRVRDFAGLQMKGGTIVLGGGAEIRTGAWMVRGTIVSLVPLRMMPTFPLACSYNPTFLSLYAKRLKPLGLDLPVDAAAGAYERYVGDAAVPGKGEILVWRPRAS
jgi:formylmethanofuran dehydrogenase subunit C